MDILNVMLDKDAILPMRAHEDDAGLDLITPVDFCVPANGSAKVDTGVHVAIPRGYDGKLESKSGLMDKDIVCLGGEIDCGYTGSISVKLYNFGEENYNFKRGEKIVQLVIRACATPKLNVVDSLGNTERGNNGFGSTGK